MTTWQITIWHWLTECSSHPVQYVGASRYCTGEYIWLRSSSHGCRPWRAVSMHRFAVFLMAPMRSGLDEFFTFCIWEVVSLVRISGMNECICTHSRKRNGKMVKNARGHHLPSPTSSDFIPTLWGMHHAMCSEPFQLVRKSTKAPKTVRARNTATSAFGALRPWPLEIKPRQLQRP